MKKLKSILLIISLIFFFLSCNSIPNEYKTACEKYDIYYFPKTYSHLYVTKQTSYGYFIFGYNGKYYLKAELIGNGDRNYYGIGYPSLDAALTAALTKNTGGHIDVSTLKNYKTICD